MVDKYKVAEERANILWKYYHKHGILLLEDVKRLTETSYDNVCKTFEYHKLDAPPVYNSQKEKLKRKVDTLWAIRKEPLTERDIAKALKIKKSRVLGVLTQIRKNGYEIPKICEENEEKKDTKQGNEYDGIFKAHGNVSGLSYSYSPYLQAIEKWNGPKENEITYRLY